MMNVYDRPTLPFSTMNPPSNALNKLHPSVFTTVMTRPDYSVLLNSTLDSKYAEFDKIILDSLNTHVEHMDPLTDPSKIEVEVLKIREIKKLSKEQVEVLTDTSLGYFSKSQRKALQERVEIIIREHGSAERGISEISQKIKSLEAIRKMEISEIKKLSKEQVEVLTDTSLGYFSKSQRKALQERVEIIIRKQVREHGIAEQGISEISRKIKSLDSLTVKTVKNLKFTEASALRSRLETYRKNDINASENKTLTSVLKKLKEICDIHIRSIEKSRTEKNKLKPGRTLKKGALESMFHNGATVIVCNQAL